MIGTNIFSTVMLEMVTLAPAVKVLPERREEGAGDSFYFYKIMCWVLNRAPRVWAEKYIFWAQNTDETAT